MEVIYQKTIVELMQENVEISLNIGKKIEKFVLDKEEFNEFLKSDYCQKKHWISNPDLDDLDFHGIPVKLSALYYNDRF